MCAAHGFGLAGQRRGRKYSPIYAEVTTSQALSLPIGLLPTVSSSGSARNQLTSQPRAGIFLAGRGIAALDFLLIASRRVLSRSIAIHRPVLAVGRMPVATRSGLA